MTIYALDAWNNLNDPMDQDSTMRHVARDISSGNVKIEQQLVQLTVADRENLGADMYGRLDATLKSLRGCRLVGYHFIKDTNLEALREEVHFVLRLPLAVPMTAVLEGFILQKSR